MPQLTRPDGSEIRFETSGTGPPLLLLAPGVVNSEIDAWERDYPGLLAELARNHTVIAMDQRYAGASTGPMVPFSYEAMSGDQVAVIQACAAAPVLVVGVGIGANYALRLASVTPEFVRAALVVEPFVRSGSSPPAGYALFEETFRVARADGIRGVVDAARNSPHFDSAPAGGPYAARIADDEHFAEETIRKGRERYVVRVVRFRDAMFPADRTFFSVDDDELKQCRIPIAIAPGNDQLHPPVAGELLSDLGADVSVTQRPRTVDDWLTTLKHLEERL